jgi:GTP cyclohydrolase I
MSAFATRYNTATIDGLEVFYREAGDPHNPTLLLLHGFPSSSHMFRNLINSLSDDYHLIAPDHIGFGRSSMPSVTEFPNVSRLNELMIVGPISVRSACSHHMCPILGRIWIGVLPNEHSNLIGLSKYSRIVDWIMTRPQIQEEAVTMLANVLQERVKPDGLAIVMEADHFCMQWRGVKDLDSAMTNSVMRGAFLKDPHLRREFLSLLSKKTA